MRSTRQWVGKATHVRQRLAHVDDVRAQVGFQNDVNALIAAVEDLETPRSKLPHGIEAMHELLPVHPLASPVIPRGQAQSALAQIARMRRSGRQRAKTA